MLKPVFLYYFIISVPSASGCPLVLGSFYLLTNPTILADLSICDVLWTHAVPLAVPLILFSRLKFECSFPLPSIHLLSMFSLWPLDLKGGDNLCIQACLAEQLASPSLSGLQPVSLGEVRRKDFFFLPWQFLISPRQQDPSEAFQHGQAGFVKCSGFSVVAVAWYGCELHSYKAEWSSNNISGFCGGRIHTRELVCPEHLSISVTGQGSKLQQWREAAL